MIARCDGDRPVGMRKLRAVETERVGCTHIGSIWRTAVEMVGTLTGVWMLQENPKGENPLHGDLAAEMAVVVFRKEQSSDRVAVLKLSLGVCVHAQTCCSLSVSLQPKQLKRAMQ